LAINSFPQFIRDHYEIHEWKHASAILSNDFPKEWQDIIDVLATFRLLESHIREKGGRKSSISGSLDREFYKRDWKEKGFSTKVVIDGNELESPTHKVDCYKNHIALEVEWNNKDPFYDRDLNNFRLLFELRAISVGLIVTRCSELQEIFDTLGKGSSYGSSTTHMGKLLPRLEGGSGGGCPVLVFGITKKLYVPGE
jgi:Restriction endonuclease BglII